MTTTPYATYSPTEKTDDEPNNNNTNNNDDNNTPPIVVNDKITLANFENKFLHVTTPLGILTDCLYNSTRSKRLLVLTYALVSVIVIYIIIALLTFSDTEAPTLEWGTPPPAAMGIAVPTRDFSVKFNMGGVNADPIVGAKVEARLVPVRSFPLTINIKPQNQSKILRWVDCLSILSGALTPLNIQDYPLCNVSAYLVNNTATTDADGVATFKKMTLTYGPSTEYLITAVVVDTAVAGGDGMEIRKTSSISAPTTNLEPIDLTITTSEETDFPGPVITARMSWTAPTSAIQAALGAATRAGQLANSTRLVNFAAAGISATNNAPALTMQPLCKIIALDLTTVRDPNIFSVAASAVLDGVFTHQNFTFEPEPGSTNQQGSANVTFRAYLQSVSSGLYFVASCLGTNVPISAFLAGDSRYPQLRNLVVPLVAHPEQSLVQTLTLNLTSGNKTFIPRNETNTTIEIFEFFETQEITASIGMKWKPSTSTGQVQNRTMRVYCQLEEVPLAHGPIDGADADIFAESGSKQLVNGSLDIKLDRDNPDGVFQGVGTLNAEFSASGFGHNVGFLFGCIAYGIRSNTFIFLIKSTVSPKLSTAIIAPQPWSSNNSQFGSSSSSASATTTRYTEKLGRPWLSAPQLRIVSNDGRPLPGKTVAIQVISGADVAVKHKASTSDSQGLISFSYIECTSMGPNYLDIPRESVFAFVIDGVIVYNHTVLLHDNPSLPRASFCNARLHQFQYPQKNHTLVGFSLGLQLYVSDGYDRPLKNQLVRVSIVNDQAVLICGSRDSTLANPVPDDNCPPVSSVQYLMSDDHGIIDFETQRNNTRYAVAGVVEEFKNVVFEFQCAQPGQTAYTDTTNIATAGANTADIITSTSHAMYHIASLISEQNVPSSPSSGSSYSIPVSFNLEMQDSFWEWVNTFGTNFSQHIPANVLRPQGMFFVKPPDAVSMHPGDQPRFVNVSNPRIVPTSSSKLLSLDAELLYSRNAPGLYIGAISYDGSSRVLYSSLTSFGSISIPRRLYIARPLFFVTSSLSSVIPGQVADQQPIITVYDKDDNPVAGVEIFAVIRLWNTTTNRAIRDINPFAFPDDLEIGALVDSANSDGRPASAPSLPNDPATIPAQDRGAAIFRKLTLLGLATGSAFKVVYVAGAGENSNLRVEYQGVEIEQDTVFTFGASPSSIRAATPSPYAVPNVPVAITVKQPLAVPMLLIPRARGVYVQNYDKTAAQIQARTIGGIMNDTDVGRAWYFNPGSFVSSDFSFTFPPNTPAGSYRFYCLYPGGRTPEVPVGVVDTPNAISVSVQPNADTTIGSTFSAAVTVTANSIPLPNVGVLVKLQPVPQCDKSRTYFTSSGCGVLSGSTVIITDQSGQAAATLTVDAGLEANYSLSFTVTTDSDESLSALARSSMNKLSMTSGSIFNASALPQFGAEVSKLLFDSNDDGGDSLLSSAASSIVGGLASSLLAPLTSKLTSGTSSLPFKLWNPVSEIVTLYPINFGTITPPIKYSSSLPPPSCQVLGRDGSPLKDVLVEIIPIPGSGATIIFASGSNQARTGPDGIASFRNLEISSRTGSGDMTFTYVSMGFSQASPSRPPPPGTSNVTVQAAPMTDKITLIQEMRYIAFGSIILLIPLLVANVRRTHIAFAVAASILTCGLFGVGLFHAITASANLSQNNFQSGRWIIPAYSLFIVLLAGLLTASTLWLLSRLYKGRDAFENDLSSRLVRSYKYTQWLVNVRRPKDQTLESYRNDLNEKVRDSLLYRIQVKIDDYLPLRLARLHRVEQINELPAIQVPPELEPAALPLKFWIIIGISSVVILSLCLVSFYASDRIRIGAQQLLTYLPTGGNQVTLTTAGVTDGAVDVSITLSAQQFQVQSQRTIIELLQLGAEITGLDFLNNWASFISKVDFLNVSDTVRTYLQYVDQYIVLAQGVAQGLAIVSIVVTVVLMAKSIRQIVIDSRRGKYFEDRVGAKFMRAELFIGLQAMLFAIQHQLVFWTVFLSILVVVILILQKMLLPLLYPLLVSGVVFIGRMVTIELVAIKFIRSFTDHVKNPFLYSVYTVVSSILAIFDAFFKVALRVALGIFFSLTIFARSDIGIFPFSLRRMDPAYVAFFASMSLDNRYSNPIMLTAVAILSVEAKIGQLARKERQTPKKNGEEDFFKINGSTSDVERQQSHLASQTQINIKDGEKEPLSKPPEPIANFRVHPKLFAKQCSVPTAASLIEHYTQVLIDRWREKTQSSRNDDDKEEDSTMSRLPLASELCEENQKSRRYERVAMRFQLLLLLHYNPSLRRLRKHTLMIDAAYRPNFETTSVPQKQQDERSKNVASADHESSPSASAAEAV